MSSSDTPVADAQVGPVLHRTLARQLRNHKLTTAHAPSIEVWQSLLQAVSAVYSDDDHERKTLERAVEISSREMRNLNDRLTRQASTDALTGLLNRTSLIEQLERHLGGQQSDDSGLLALLFIDLDGFKLINDRLGHAVGDDLLRIVAERLRGCLRSGDVVARLGGDEFVVLVPGLPHEKPAIAMAERIVSSLSQTVCLPNNAPMGVGASIGVTTTPRGTEATAEQLLIEADSAMYAAKMNGRNRVVVFSPGLASGSNVRSTVEELRKAIVNDELVLHYQPIVCLPHERVVAQEALVRWEHPEQGMIPPVEFIPLAENSGLIHDLTRSVVGQALQALATWPPHLLVSVNLSPKDLLHHSTIDMLGEQSALTGVDLSRVVVEITENSLISWDETVLAQLQSMLDTGIRLAIDDFGSGYSSLSQLLDLPIQIVKLDRKFVESVAQDDASQAVVRTVIELARTLGMAVVAEGIETADQANVLRRVGCGLGQGYHFGRPDPAPAHDDLGCPECAGDQLGFRLVA